jgi:hypothetical protein
VVEPVVVSVEDAPGVDVGDDSVEDISGLVGGGASFFLPQRALAAGWFPEGCDHAQVDVFFGAREVGSASGPLSGAGRRGVSVSWGHTSSGWDTHRRCLSR